MYIMICDTYGTVSEANVDAPVDPDVRQRLSADGDWIRPNFWPDIGLISGFRMNHTLAQCLISRSPLLYHRQRGALDQLYHS